jgi:hypothetical protein
MRCVIDSSYRRPEAAIEEEKTMYVTKRWDAKTNQAKKKNPVTSAGFFETKDSVAEPVSFTILHIEALTLIIIVIVIYAGQKEMLHETNRT